MAGDWIKMRSDLGTDPAVIRTGIATGLDPFAVVGRLHALWAWADAHTTNGTVPGVTAAWIDRLVCHEGFATALVAAGWLHDRADGFVIPKFDRHMGDGAKARAQKTKRQSKWRAGAATKPRRSRDAGVDAGVDARPSTLRLPEKRREEKKTTPSELAKPPAPGECQSQTPRVRKVADSPHARCVAAFCGAWAAKYGTKFPFEGGKHGKMIQTILELLGSDEAKYAEVVGRYFATDDPFVAGTKHSLDLLKSQLPKWVAGNPVRPVVDQRERRRRQLVGMVNMGSLSREEAEAQFGGVLDGDDGRDAGVDAA